MMNLFIDTNVFLSFYHLTNEDLEELKKLVALIEKKEILLFLPDHVKKEFTRNRAGKILDAVRKLQEAKFNLSFPVFAKEYKGYGELRDLMKKADTLHAALIKEIMSDAELEQLNADSVVSTLFSKAKKIEVTDVHYLKAIKRVRLGHPPGKEGSIGDAVNWECLLSTAPKQEDIFIVSGDRDFRSPLHEDQINEYLGDEWWQEKAAFVHFYPKISNFFKEKYPNIKIASEVESDLLIQRLAASGSFASTHVHIAGLAACSQFSPAQVEQLIEIVKLNNQVGLIIGDADVHAFYAGLLDKYGKVINPDAAAELASKLKSEESTNDDTPF
jgi:predicted nucleic acid-binding protein